MEICVRYFVKQSKCESLEGRQRTFVDVEYVIEVFTENTEGLTDNMNDRLNRRINLKSDALNSIVMRPRLSIQQNDGTSSTIGFTTLDDLLLNQTDNLFGSDLTGVNFNNNFLFRHRFKNSRRTFSVGRTPPLREMHEVALTTCCVQTRTFRCISQLPTRDPALYSPIRQRALSPPTWASHWPPVSAPRP